MEKIKGFVGMMVGGVIGSEVAKSIGNSGLGAGFKEATQTLVSAGTLGFVAGKSLDMFRWKK